MPSLARSPAQVAALTCDRFAAFRALFTIDATLLLQLYSPRQALGPERILQRATERDHRPQI